MNVELEKTLDDVADIAQNRPTTDQVLGQNFEHPAVLVRSVDPVTTQALPASCPATRNIALDTTPAKALNEDPRRSRAVLICDQRFYFSPDKTAVAGASAGIWPANVPLEIKTSDIWYVAAVAGTAVLSVMPEQWTD